MKNFIKLASGINITPLAIALNNHPELWNQYNNRKEFENSSHKNTSDIWIRYNAIERLNDYSAFNQEHDSVWYPSVDKLPQIKQLAYDLMAKCQAVRLGGILITKIPSGGHVLPHVDKGWHPEYYNIKVYIPIETNPFVINRVEDELVVMQEGDAWHFNNTVEHEVINNGTTDRITLIICMRTD